MRLFRRIAFWLVWAFTAGCCPGCGGARCAPGRIDGETCRHWYHPPAGECQDGPLYLPYAFHLPEPPPTF